MGVLKDIGDLVLGGIRTERAERRADPCGTAREFLARSRYWAKRGRPMLARFAHRRYELWAERCKAAGGDC